MLALLLSVLLSLNTLAASPQGTVRPGPRENAETAVVEAIRLLEGKDYATLLSQFIPPDNLKMIAGTPESFATFVREFPPRGEILLAALRDARKQKAVYDESMTTATFSLTASIGGQSALKMLKIGQFWYLANR
jgi:hypothetical protein